jgi:hypothetical protein
LAGDTWPVLPGSEKPPQNWPGWPDGKKFALVLTHDVEGRSGVAKCRQLMELERQLGFRSCFSFVPQGEYSISRILRNELTRNGFEVGVHDLHHDGKLFHNRQDFTEKAARINGYLKDWGAVGFRSAAKQIASSKSGYGMLMMRGIEVGIAPVLQVARVRLDDLGRARLQRVGDRFECRVLDLGGKRRQLMRSLLRAPAELRYGLGRRCHSKRVTAENGGLCQNEVIAVDGLFACARQNFAHRIALEALDAA